MRKRSLKDVQVHHSRQTEFAKSLISLIHEFKNFPY